MSKTLSYRRRGTATLACRYHSRPKTQPNNGGGILVNTPNVRGPDPVA